jgi:lipopolysaccharide/colanic/teichoic acid biosynthesis glycosyltransferase
MASSLSFDLSSLRDKASRWMKTESVEPTSMKNNEALNISSYEQPELKLLQPEAQRQPTAAPVKDSLQLVWRNLSEVAGSRTNTAHPAATPHSSHATEFDRGLWLLHDGFIRREGWLRLSAELVATPLPRQESLRPRYATAKRFCDVAGSLALLTVLAPILAIIAILIKLDSPGPILFRQRRIGRNGEEFLIWKFRSMRENASRYAPSPTSNLDSRLTSVGRLIRRISFDELPQLINVLKGEMSLVGPRPEMPFIVDGYTDFERERLAVKPGITGLWQVSPARAHPIHENLQYDLHYIRHQNLMLDAAIILRTIAAVIHGVGAV